MSTARTDGFHPVEAVGLAALGAVLIAGGLVWLVGGLAGLLFGEGWPAARVDEAPRIAARLPDALDDPRQAWPRGVRSDLPGPWGFAGAGGVVLLAAVAFTLVVIRFARRRRRPAAARWASPRELRPLRVSRAGRGRVGLGRAGRSVLAAEPRQSVLVVAPTQSGKTTAVAVPAILEWEGPVLATSVKSDLLRHTLDRRRDLGEVRIFDPVATTGFHRAHWTPLASCGDWQGARRTADRLARAAQSTPTPAHGAEFWDQAGARFLAPLLLAAATTGRGMDDVTRWIDTESHEEVLQALDGPDYATALNAAISVWGADERLQSSLYATATVALEAYNDPLVLACSERAELTADWLLSGSNTAYLCAPVDEQARLRPLFTTLVREIVAAVYARAASTGRPLDPPLLLVLDEAANIAPLPDLAQIASTGAGQGLQVVTVVQDLAQVHERWSRTGETIVNNHRAKLFGSGTACTRTVDYVSRLLGDAEVPQRSFTAGEEGRRSTTESSIFRPIAPPQVLRGLRPGSMLLLYGSLPPAVVTARPWFRDRRLRRLAHPHGESERP